jgi:hypothetical protein
MVMMMKTVEKVEIPLAVIPTEFPLQFLSCHLCFRVSVFLWGALFPRTLLGYI